MKFVKRRSLIAALLLVVFMMASPALAAWGAGWGSGSVFAYGTVTGLQNARKNGATVTATVGTYGSALVNNAFSSTANIPGIVFCGNPGSKNNIAPGVNPVVLNANFADSQFIAGNQIDQNGKAQFNVHDKPSQTLLNTVFDANALCPGGNSNNGTNWTIIDFVPQQFAGLLQGFDGSGTLLTQAVYDCSMPWSTVESLSYQQQVPYNCTERINQRVN